MLQLWVRFLEGLVQNIEYLLSEIGPLNIVAGSQGFQRRLAEGH